MDDIQQIYGIEMETGFGLHEKKVLQRRSRYQLLDILKSIFSGGLQISYTCFTFLSFPTTSRS